MGKSSHPTVKIQLKLLKYSIEYISNGLKMEGKEGKNKNIVPLELRPIARKGEEVGTFINRFDMYIDHVQRQDNYQYWDKGIDREYRILVQYAINDINHEDTALKITEEFNYDSFNRFMRWVGYHEEFYETMFNVKIVMSLLYQKKVDDCVKYFPWDINHVQWDTEKVRIVAIYDNTDSSNPPLKINEEYVRYKDALPSCISLFID